MGHIKEEQIAECCGLWLAEGSKSSSKRLRELRRLGLVKMEEDGKWIKISTKKQIVVI